MLRRTRSFGLSILALLLAAAPALAAETEVKDAKETSNTTKASATQKKANAIPTFTNADIEALPATDNSDLPSLDPDADAQASANRFVIIGTPPAEGEKTEAAAPDPADGAQSMEWVERMLAEREQADRIAAAQRRVQQAELRVAEVERTYRPKGSAFAEGRNTTEWFVRGVASTSERYDNILRNAYVELAAARAELDAVLAASAERRAKVADTPS